MGDYSKAKECIVFDIDGTLADMSHRVKYVDGSLGKKDFDKFYSEMHKDTVIEPVFRAANLWNTAKYTLFFCTGRPEEYREITYEWLVNKGVGGVDSDRLLMRPNERRYESDAIVKKDMCEEIVNVRGYRILCVYEDRQRVVDMWRSRGVFVLQCAKGAF